MAKVSVNGFDLKTIRSLLTAAERKVFDSSTGKALAAAGRDQLQAAVGQARTLRDKWRDLYAQQTRTTKRTAKAGTAANDRSRDKADLFAGAVERLEKRLAEIGTPTEKNVVKTSVKTAKKTAKKAALPPSKKARTAGHRATRAGVKSELKRAVTAVGGKKHKSKR